jgi:hypothetical protein
MKKVGELVGVQGVSGPVYIAVTTKRQFLGAYLDHLQTNTYFKLKKREDGSLETLGWSYFYWEDLMRTFWSDKTQYSLDLRKLVEESELAAKIKTTTKPKLGSVSKENLNFCSKGVMVRFGPKEFLLVEMTPQDLKDLAKKSFKHYRKLHTQEIPDGT